MRCAALPRAGERSQQRHAPALAGVRRVVVSAESGNLLASAGAAAVMPRPEPPRTRRVGTRAMPRWLLRARTLSRRTPRGAGAAKASAETAAAASPAAASHFLQNGMDSLYAVMT